MLAPLPLQDTAPAKVGMKMWLVNLLLSQMDPLSAQVPADTAFCAICHRGTAQLLAFLLLEAEVCLPTLQL